MKKLIVISCAFITVCGMRAADQAAVMKEAAEIAERLEKAVVVKYVVTLYCDKDMKTRQEWQHMVEQAADVITLGESNAKETEVIDGVIKALEAIKSKHKSGVYAGTISVGLGDGICAPDRCGEQCECVKNSGVCPCSAVKGERCCSK